MKLIYSSRGEFSAIQTELKKALPKKESLDFAYKILEKAKEEPSSVELTVFEPKEIRELSGRSDPQDFLLLRDMSVYLKNAYEEAMFPLLAAGYESGKKVLIRFSEGVSATEVLAAGICAAVSKAKAVFSFPRASLTPEICSSLRLSGVDCCYLSGDAEAVARAIFPPDRRDFVSSFIGSGSEEFRSALSLCSAESHVAGEKLVSVYAAFDNFSPKMIESDLACTEERELPVLISVNEAFSAEICEKFKDKPGYAVVASSEEECASIAKKCMSRNIRTYGSSPFPDLGFRAEALSPAMARVALPMAIYPYVPSDMLYPPRNSSSVPSVLSFASGVAKYVERGKFPEEEAFAIGERI